MTLSGSIFRLFPSIVTPHQALRKIFKKLFYDKPARTVSYCLPSLWSRGKARTLGVVSIHASCLQAGYLFQSATCTKTSQADRSAPFTLSALCPPGQPFKI